MDRVDVVDHAWVRERFATTPPLALIDELSDAHDAGGLFLRSLALAAICDAKAVCRDREAAAALAPGDEVLQRSVLVCRAHGKREHLELANRFWDEASDDADGWRVRRMAAGLALHAIPHRNAGHRRAAERLEMAADASVTVDPSSPSPLADLALAQAELGKIDAAQATLDTLRERGGYPPWPSLWRVDAIVARRKKDWPRSKASWLQAQRLMGRPTGVIAGFIWRLYPMLSIVIPSALLLAAIVSTQRWLVAVAAASDVVLLSLSAWVFRPPARRFLMSITIVLAGCMVLWLSIGDKSSSGGLQDEVSGPVPILDGRHLEDEVVRFAKAMVAQDQRVIEEMSGGLFSTSAVDWGDLLEGFRVATIHDGERCVHLDDAPLYEGQVAGRCFVVRLRGPEGQVWTLEIDTVLTLEGWSLSGGLAGPIPPS